MKMRVSDYIAQKLADYGIRHVFMITGGGAMFLNDSLGNQPGIRCIYQHHEQASAIAAEGYARISNRMSVVCTTTGPGAVNALNGVYGAWVDSIPMLIISGQVKRETCVSHYPLEGLRQLGDQEIDIITMVKGVTKFAVMVNDPQTIRHHLEKAIYLAEHGRPGPCWLDIPVDVQSVQIDPDHLQGYIPEGNGLEENSPELRESCDRILQRLATAQRPVILVGKGVRLANALPEFEQLIRRLQVPVVAAWTGIDLLPYDDPLYGGCSADIGTRAGNFAVQNADLLLVLGSRLSLRQVSYNWKAFARQAYKIQVDIDPVEMRKPTVKIDLPIAADLKDFLSVLNQTVEERGFVSNQEWAGWLNWCQERVARYPVFQPHHMQIKNNTINPYLFVHRLFERLDDKDIVVCGNGAANVVTFQAARIKKGQRLFCNTGDASMGYDLPAAIGAAFAANGKRILCMAGDGSIQFNLQEFQTLVHHHLPVIVFVFNNGGYLSIRLSQGNFFHRLTGEGEASGVSFPDIVRVAQAYQIEAFRMDANNFEEGLAQALSSKGPLIVDVMMDPDQPFEPKMSSRQLPDGRIVSAPMEDMYPFLSREEMAANLLIPPYEA